MKYILWYCEGAALEAEEIGEFKTLKSAITKSYEHFGGNHEDLPWFQIKDYHNQNVYWWTTDIADTSSPHYEIDRED